MHLKMSYVNIFGRFVPASVCCMGPRIPHLRYYLNSESCWVKSVIFYDLYLREIYYFQRDVMQNILISTYNKNGSIVNFRYGLETWNNQEISCHVCHLHHDGEALTNTMRSPVWNTLIASVMGNVIDQDVIHSLMQLANRCIPSTKGQYCQKRFPAWCRGA